MAEGERGRDGGVSIRLTRAMLELAEFTVRELSTAANANYDTTRDFVARRRCERILVQVDAAAGGEESGGATVTGRPPIRYRISAERRQKVEANMRQLRSNLGFSDWKVAKAGVQAGEDLVGPLATLECAVQALEGQEHLTAVEFAARKSEIEILTRAAERDAAALAEQNGDPERIMRFGQRLGAATAKYQLLANGRVAGSEMSTPAQRRRTPYVDAVRTFLDSIFEGAPNAIPTFNNALGSLGARGALPLAEWLTSSWWRLRWEPPSTRWPTIEWLNAHRAPSFPGSPHAVPTVVTQGARTCAIYDSILEFGSDPNATRHQVLAGDFERGVDSFVRDAVLSFGPAELGPAGRHVADMWAILVEERQVPAKSRHRILEAMFGYDRGRAPAASMDLLAGITERAGFTSGAEIAAACAGFLPTIFSPSGSTNMLEQYGFLPTIRDQAQRLKVLETFSRMYTPVEGSGVMEYLGNTGPDILEVLRAVIDMPGSPIAASGRFVCQAFSPGSADSLTGQVPSWSAGVRMAQEFRKTHGIPVGPVSDSVLGDLLGLSTDKLLAEYGQAASIPFGLAACDPANGQTWFSFCKQSRLYRRFDAARLIAAANLPGSGTVLVASEAKTARQIAQRAFAAEFLAPSGALRNFMEPNYHPDALNEAGGYFGVPPQAIRDFLIQSGGWV
jgi:hypothetical protein